MATWTARSTGLRASSCSGVADYWDGPLSGLAGYAGRDYCFAAEPFDWDDPPRTRRYLLLPLRDDELADERAWQLLFREYVGSDPGRGGGKLKPRREWSKFYDGYSQRRPRDYATRQPVGWFILG